MSTTHITPIELKQIDTPIHLVDRLNLLIRDLNGRFAALQQSSQQAGTGTALGGSLTPNTSGLVNDLQLGQGSVFYASSTKALTITGFAGGQLSRLIVVINTGAVAWTLAHESGSSQAQNRLHTRTGASVVIGAGGGMTLLYDAVLSRWTPLAAVI